jgi:ubiquinone/menaquinone biosynthesis C-methylase UbiE
MKKKKDAFGQMLLNYFLYNQSYELLERDDGVIDVSFDAVKNYFSCYDEWPSHEKKALTLVKGKILDVGAGAGRISLHLQKDNSVIAIDNSPNAIKVCKKRGVKIAKNIAFEDILLLNEKNFDCVLMLGNNFGLFSNKDKAKILLNNLYCITKENALIIAESTDPLCMSTKSSILYRNRNIIKNKLPGQTKIRLRFGEIVGDWFDFLFVSKSDLEDIIQNTGWGVKEYIDKDQFLFIAVIQKLT